MITLDTNVYLICSMFNISNKKLTGEYSGMSLEEIMEVEAEQGNTAAANFDMSILNDPIRLIQLFQLDDAENKYAILSNMSEQDLESLLPYLDQESMALGLNLFTKDKLIALTEQLPMEQLVNLTLQMFSPEQLITYMPEKEMNKFLKSPEMDKGLMEKYLTQMPPEVLAKMIEATTGESVVGAENVNPDGSINIDQQTLLGQISEFSNSQFQEAMINMPPVHKQEFVLSMVKENPKLLQLFDASAYTGVIAARKNKEDIVKSSKVIEPEQLVKMLQELPKDLTALVMTQIDTKQFAQILIANFKDVLSQIAVS